jgi:hypothetical protein
MVAIAFKKSSDVSNSEISTIDTTPILANGTEREEIALYLAQMTGELAALARSAQYDLLGYFLEMARIEAKGHAGVLRAPN